MNITDDKFKESLNVGDLSVEISVAYPDGRTADIQLKSPEDFPNEVVTEGKKICLVYLSSTIYSGIYRGVEEDEGEIVIFLE